MPAADRLDHEQLRRFLNAIRLQLWWRDALAVGAASALVGAVAGAATSVWPVRPDWLSSGPSAAVWLMLAALAMGGVVAVARRPSVIRAARVADRQLSTSSRLATAAEVLDGRLGGTLAPAQLADAWRLASSIRPLAAYPHAWRGVQLAAFAATGSVALFALTLSGAVAPVEIPGVFGGPPAQSSSAANDDTVASNDATADADAESALAAQASANPAGQAQTLQELQAAAAQSQAAEAALQKLGDILRSTAAARDVGESLRSGNYDDAADKLVKLGRDADQLSRISKRELANAMQRAAYDTAQVDPPLAVSEDAVARALNRQVYTETRAALENLARAVSDAKKGVISQDALGKSLEQLAQQQPTTGAAGAEDGEEPYVPDIPGEEPKQVGLVRGASSTIQVPGPEGDPKTADRSGTGLNPGGDPLGDLTARLNVPPIDVPIDTQLANDRGRPQSNPAAPTVKISDTNQNGVRPSDVVQPSDPVRDVAEQTVEPIAERDAVRAFFKSAGDSATTDKTP